MLCAIQAERVLIPYSYIHQKKQKTQQRKDPFGGMGMGGGFGMMSDPFGDDDFFSGGFGGGMGGGSMMMQSNFGGGGGGSF